MIFASPTGDPRTSLLQAAAGWGHEPRSGRMANLVALEGTLAAFPRRRKSAKAEFWKRPHESARRINRIRPRAVKLKPQNGKPPPYPDRRQISTAGGAVRVSRMFHPCFRAVETTERRRANLLAPAIVRKPPEIFILTFIMRRSRSP
jgi:hypothetical protein